jgi:hypothetical protein
MKLEQAAWKPQEEHERHAPPGLTAGPVPTSAKTPAEEPAKTETIIEESTT